MVRRSVQVMILVAGLSGLTSAPALSAVADDCDNETVKFVENGYKVKIACKGLWSYFVSTSFNPIVDVNATEVGTGRKCVGQMVTAGGAADVDKHKVECKFDSKHKVKFEVQPE